MIREFELPDIGEGVAEAELISWLVAVGDTVEEDQPVAEVETDKALVELPSPVDGTVRELLVDAGKVVPVGTVLVTFDVHPKEDDRSDEETKDTVETGVAGDISDPRGEFVTRTAVPDQEGDQRPEGSTHIFAAPSVRRRARKLGIDLSRISGSGPGGRITEDDILRASADRTDVKNASPSPGIAEREAAVDDTVPSKAGARAIDMSINHGSVDSVDRGQTLAAPATRRLAQELDVDLNAVPTTEQRDGVAFVTPEQVRAYAEARVSQRDTDVAESSAQVPRDREHREAYRGVRRVIGERMERASVSVPHVTHHDDVDVTALVETRTNLKTVAETHGVVLSYIPFVIKAVVAGLKEIPIVNSSLDEETEEIIYKKYYDIGIATATDEGLMVPVVRSVDQKGMLQLAAEVNELVERARTRAIGVEEMRGGTFTITNIGAIGGEYATPIVNYPEAAILALGAIRKKPRVVQDEVVARDVLTLSLSFDHRIVDGADGARFTNEVKKYLNDPALLLLE